MSHLSRSLKKRFNTYFLSLDVDSVNEKPLQNDLQHSFVAQVFYTVLQLQYMIKFLICTYFNPNRHTVPCIPNRYGERGACEGLSPSPTLSTSRSISHWWARWVSVACLSHVLRGGTGRAGGGGPGGGVGERGVSAPHSQCTEPIHTKFYNFLLSY